jgi:hypothetical protein
VTDQSREELSRTFRQAAQRVLLETDREADLSDLEKHPDIVEINATGKNKWEILAGGGTDIRPVIFEHAVAHKYTLLSIKELESNMEEIFRSLTAKEG